MAAALLPPFLKERCETIFIANYTSFSITRLILSNSDNMYTMFENGPKPKIQSFYSFHQKWLDVV